MSIIRTYSTGALMGALVLLASLVFVGFFQYAHAQGTLSVTVTPPLVQLTIGPGEKWKSSLKVVNNNNHEVTYYAQVVNFDADGESGQSAFSPLIDDDPEHRRATLAGWITLDEKPVIVDEGESGEIVFEVDIPENASPGGHYAAILVGTQPTQTQSEGASVQISSLVSSLLFVRIEGDIEEHGRIREFRSDSSHYDTPNANFILRFENIGNTHLRPQGDITIYNMWGKERGQLLINHKSNFGNVLPESTRRFEFAWEGEASVFDIGRYSAVVTLAYGEEARRNVSATTYFWVVPIIPVTATLVSVIAFLVLMVWFIRRYIRTALEIERKRIEELVAHMPNITQEEQPKMEYSVQTFVKPLQAGVIDLRNMAKGSVEAEPIPQAEEDEFVEDEVADTTQFIQKYSLFFFFVLVLLIGIAGGWVFLSKALVPERSFNFVEVIETEKDQQEAPNEQE